VRVARWEDWSRRGLQHLVLDERADVIVAEAVCIVAENGGYAARYRLRCDPAWRCRELDVEVIGAAQALRLRGDGHGRWTDGDGVHLAALDGALDVDLPITPFTNTLPIRRLELAGGASAEITVVYVRTPELSVEADQQRYTCIAPRRRYRYEAVDGSFSAELTVDAQGLVVTYPGLFRRRED
jgi:uncharacterized protein